MADSPLSVVTDFLRAAAARSDALSDAELLAEFAAGSSDAFAVLVRRHGPMVLGVCRRTLGPTPDADDAFQATFLSLARGAKRVSDTVPGWLFRVATRTARKALRRSTESPVETTAPAAPDAMEWGEVRRLLDEELSGLPDRWRAPLVLCYLDGLTRAAAAKRLGWSLRTLHRRLDEGRERLRARLVRRGLAPALLATAVVSNGEAPAAVPPLLARETLARGLGESTVPPTVQALIFRPVVKGGLAMNLALTFAAIVGGLGLALGGQSPSADHPPIDPDPPALVFAPIPKPRTPPDPLDDEIKPIRKKAVAYLLKEQKAGEKGTAHWEADTASDVVRGGPTALALLALMENGVSSRDDAVAKGLAYLRTLDPTTTYIVSLQTQAFCRANQKEDADRIKKNVQWLEKASARGKGQLLGWNYTATPGGRADNSNTRYAVAGLLAAHEAGFKLDGTALWSDIRELFVRTQRKTGGWSYMEFGGNETHTMTFSGLVCLEAAARALGKPEDASAAARKAGEQWAADNFQLRQTHTYYNLDVIGAYGRLAELHHLGTGDKKRDWFREGLDLVKARQEEDGHFKHDTGDMSPIVSTSFVLRFLASRVIPIHAPTEPTTPISFEQVPKEKSPDDILHEKVQETSKKAVAFLKDKQIDQGKGVFNWESGGIALLQEGGQTALVLLALLENGEKPDDPVVARGLKYLRSLPPQYTYVVSLQTQVFCKANQKDDAKLIARNVDWLEKAAARRGPAILGWSYKSPANGAGDNSNTRYAISALFAAHQAGFKVKDPKFWQEVRDFYRDNQTAVGSWNYRSGEKIGKGTHTMTLAGLLGLRQALEILVDADVASDGAIKKGEAWLADGFRLEHPPHTFYNFDLIAAYGRQSGQRLAGPDKKKIDWYRIGCEWLFANQKGRGEFRIDNNLDQFELISTSFALRFLASRPE